jgi:hypothetical protein
MRKSKPSHGQQDLLEISRSEPLHLQWIETIRSDDEQARKDQRSPISGSMPPAAASELDWS